MIEPAVLATTLWAPGFDSVPAFLEGRPDPGIDAPSCELASPRLLRGTSLVTRMQVDVAARACEEAGLPLATTPTVFGSAYGEIEIALAQFDMMRTGDGIVSPARFKNSVHNTGAGVFSIAAENRGFTTSLAAGEGTVAMVLLEALGLLADGAEAVVAAVADEPLPSPLCGARVYEGLAVAFALGRAAPGRPTLRWLGMRADAPAAPPLSAELADNPCAPALHLLEALGRGRAGVVPLHRRGEQRYAVELVAP